MSLNIVEIFTKEYLRDYLSRNKILIIISLLLLVFSAILGVIFSDSIKPIIMELLKEMLNNLPKNQSVVDQSIYIFTNNIRANIIILLSGFIFSIPSIFAIFVNGLLIGFTYTLVTPIQYVVGIFPHGIFEIPATALSLVGAFLITKLELNILRSIVSGNFREEISKSNIIIKDIILSICITFIFLVIAAIIESWITPVLLSMVL